MNSEWPWAEIGLFLSASFLISCLALGLWQFWTSSVTPVWGNLARAWHWVFVLARLQFVYGTMRATLSESSLGNVGVTQWFVWAVATIVAIDLLRVLIRGQPG